MAKQNGPGDQFYLAGYDLSGDVSALDRIAAQSAQFEVPGIDASGQERIYGAVDGELGLRLYFNDALLHEHAALKAKGAGADRVACYLHGSAIGNMAAGLVSKQVNYDWDRGADGSLAGAVQLLANAKGLDYCEQLTAGKRTDTGATNGASQNNGAASAAGLAAYLQVFAFTGTDATVKLQESSDDAGTDPYADVTGGGFTAIAAAPTAERIVTALDQAVEQYLRVVTTTSAGFSSLEFAVIVTRAPVA